jgi:hypothetical protein
VNARCLPLLLLAALAFAPRCGLGADDEVATVLGKSIQRVQLTGGESEYEQAGRLYDLVWRAVTAHYIEYHGLAATAGEVAEFAAYDREFDRRDRVQRARKLEELDQRLAAGDPDEQQREWLEEFRAVLTRMAQRDADSGPSTESDIERQVERYAPWIEMWKMNRAIYERYRGVVALTRFGHYPHGARAALLEDYERRGLLHFSDAGLRERLFALLAARPSMVVAPGDVDFTPYWKRPIPSSYYPD